MYAGGEDIHVSVWPGDTLITGDITRFIAREGRVFSLAAGNRLDRNDVADEFPLAARLSDGEWYDGGSAIAAPDGTWIEEPTSRPGLLIADVDLARVREERQNFDPTGHYSRSDIFQLSVDRRRLSVADLSDDPVSLD
jgi:nitrilase